jgi:hypothetical protein
MAKKVNSCSKLAPELHDQYFTPVDTAKWCFEVTAEKTGWDFIGTALEPAVGGFAFVKAAEQLGLKLKWTTNDLHPQSSTHPHFTLNFIEGDFAQFDYIVTNPPFGHANVLARQFMKKSLSLSNKVMMLLPKGARRIGFQDAMPRNSQRLFDRSLIDETFEIPGHEPRQVKTCVQAWERTKTLQPTIRSTLDLRNTLITTWAAADEETYRIHPKHGKAQVQVCRWGVMGKPREELKRSGAWESVAFNSDVMNYSLFQEVCSALNFDEFVDMCSSVPSFDVPIFLHRFNVRAVQLGLLEPV